MNNQTLSEAVGRHAVLAGDGPQKATYQNLSLTYEVTSNSLLLVAHQGAPVPILLAPESDFTRSADSLGVSDESKIGAADFDQKYVIRDAGGKAKQILTPEVVALVESLEPFTELEMGHDMIRLLKKPGDEDAAVKDLENLAKLTLAIRG